jgi:hypothetical protein
MNALCRDAGATRHDANDRLAPRAFGDGCVAATRAKRAWNIDGDVTFASSRKIGGPTRRSAKGGWTPEEVR